MTFKWGKLYHRSLLFFIVEGRKNHHHTLDDYEERWDGDAPKSEKTSFLTCVLAICIEKRKNNNPLLLGELRDVAMLIL